MATLKTEQARPLGMLPDVDLTTEQLRVIERIQDYEFPYVAERILNKGLISESELPEAILEFRKYFSLMYLVSGKVKSLGAISPVVDEVWHQFILFTRLYARFCQETVGRFMHHTPGTSYTPLSPESGQALVENYQMYFGELPAIWKTTNDCSESTASTGDSEWHHP